MIRDLNAVYRHFPALHGLDSDPRGFEWIAHDDRDNSVFSFIRKADNGELIVVLSNFTPVPREHYRVGVSQEGSYREIINTDHHVYGGSGLGNGLLSTQQIPSHGRSCSLEVTVPPLATIMLTLER
jgi:1,4-alpha-glucan branching enzyme